MADDKEHSMMETSDPVTGHIISTTIGGKNGEPKRTISYMAERVVGTGSFGIVFQVYIWGQVLRNRRDCCNKESATGYEIPCSFSSLNITMSLQWNIKRSCDLIWRKNIMEPETNSQPLFLGESVVDQLVEIIMVDRENFQEQLARVMAMVQRTEFDHDDISPSSS